MNICISCPEGHPVILAAAKLGQIVACPRCFATFPAEWEAGTSIGARKDDRKVRRSRDDDDDEDDDEEEEKPKKKPTAMKPGIPPAKKPTKSRARDDDDDDDDDEDDEEEEGEEEPEIEWTGRKRQLHKCGIGLIIMMVAFYMLVAMIALLILPMIWSVFDIGNEIGNKEKMVLPKASDWFWPGVIVAVMAVLVQTALIVGLFFNFFVPARVEARGLVLCALIFGGLVYLLGAGVLMGELKQDAARAANVQTLLGAAAGACFVISIFSAMAYLAKFMTFMKLHLESSQPITNAGFFFLYFGAMFGIMYANSYVSWYLFWFACFAMIIVLFFAGTMAIRAAVAQAILCKRVHGVIMKFIRDD